MSDLNELVDIVDSAGDAKAVSRVCCSDDGALAAIATETPSLVVYLTRLPCVTASYRSKVAVLSSLTEVSIFEDGNTVSSAGPLTYSPAQPARVQRQTRTLHPGHRQPAPGRRVQQPHLVLRVQARR